MLTKFRLVAEIVFIAIRPSFTSRTVGPSGLPSCVSTGPFGRLSCGSSASLQRLPESLPLSGAAGSGRSRFDVGDFIGLGRCGIDRTRPRAPVKVRSSLRFFERSSVTIDRTIRVHPLRCPARQHRGPLSSRRWIALERAFRRDPHARSIRPTIRRRFSLSRCTGPDRIRLTWPARSILPCGIECDRARQRSWGSCGPSQVCSRRPVDALLCSIETGTAR